MGYLWQMDEPRSTGSDLDERGDLLPIEAEKEM
jgi:hypothetical protein